jgi:hypothetical protein
MHQQRMPIMTSAGPLPPQTATTRFPGHPMMDPQMMQMRPGMQMQLTPQQQQQRIAMFHQQMRMPQHFQQGMQPQRPMYHPGQQPPQQQRMMSPPQQRPRMQLPMAGPRPRLLDEQPLLLEDLLEQVGRCRRFAQLKQGFIHIRLGEKLPQTSTSCECNDILIECRTS